MTYTFMPAPCRDILRALHRRLHLPGSETFDRSVTFDPESVSWLSAFGFIFRTPDGRINLTDRGMNERVFFPPEDEQSAQSPPAPKKLSSKKPKKCGCREEVNARLKEHNTRLATDVGRLIAPRRATRSMLRFTTNRMLVTTEKIDKRSRKAPLVVAAVFCPFCGRKLPEEP